ncbi:MAG: penicillin-binding protein 1C [Chitinophagales bacterium]
MILRSNIGAFILRTHLLFKKYRALRWLKRSAFAFLLCFIAFLLLNAFFPVRINITYSQIVTAEDGTVLKAFLTPDDKWRMMTELDEITPAMQKAIIYKEDKYFRRHPGVNPFAVLRALWNNIVTGERTSGASTITMQVARLLEPKDRTYGNKAMEMFRALQIDMLYSKDEILQMYLNLVPYGGNIEGVKAASVLYLEKTPGVLSLSELTALSIIPNRPTSLRPGINNNVIITERNKWLEKFRRAQLFPDDIIDDAEQEPFTAFRVKGPDIAPHFCTRMKAQYPQYPIIKTHLHTETQKKSEEIVGNYIKQIWALNIHNGAAFIIDNKSMDVVAYVGSADFYATDDAGQVDGIQAVRSPGSTLKPLLYGLAFDAGICTAQSMIADVPINFSGYSPENYDEDYRGLVSIETALAHSLNVPAVKMLHTLGMDVFLRALSHCGFSAIDAHKNDLGLSVVLGGCGVTLEQLTALYASFAHQGAYHDVHWLKSDTDTSSEKILSPGATFMLSEILTKPTRPDLPHFFEHATNVPHIAWKTGTSYGRKDAWSVGYNDQYTIGVWVGNFSGEGVPELSGAGVATPLLFQLFNAIQPVNDADWNRMPDDISFRYVCSVSGDVPQDFCTGQVLDYFIPGISPNRPCTHEQTVAVSPDEKISYCKTCMPETGYKEKTYARYSPEIIGWMQMKNIPYTPVPPHNPACERIFKENAPVIASPVNDVEYYIDKLDKQKLMLSAHVGSDVRSVFWYVNDKLIKEAKAGENVFIDAPEGDSKISCSDDKGRNTDVFIHVIYF